MPDAAWWAALDEACARCGASSVLGQSARALSRRSIVQAVVAEGPRLVLGGQLGVGIDTRGVLELVLGDGEAQIGLSHGGLAQGDEGDVLAEQAALDGGE